MEDKVNLLDPEQQQEAVKTRHPKQFIMKKIVAEYDRSLKSNYVVDSVEKAIYLLNDYLADSPNEYLIGVALDKDKHPICCCTLGMGEEHHVDKNYMNMFRFMFTSGGDSFVILHNHPTSTELKPSETDLNTFKEVLEIAGKLNLRIRDFIITGNQDQNRAYYSYHTKGVITQYEFLNKVKSADIQKPLEVEPNQTERTIDEVNELLQESKFNSEESLVKEQSSNKGLFGLFKS